MGFQQAAIRIEREQEFEELKGAINRAFGPEKVEKFLKRVQGNGIRVRDFEAVLAKDILEQVDETLAKSRAQSLYQALAAFRSGADAGVLSVQDRRSGAGAEGQVSEAVSLLLKERTSEARQVYGEREI